MHTRQHVIVVHWLAQSGVGKSPKCCFPHGIHVFDPFVIITPRFYNIIASSPDCTNTRTCDVCIRSVSTCLVATKKIARFHSHTTLFVNPSLQYRHKLQLYAPPNEDFGRRNKRLNDGFPLKSAQKIRISSLFILPKSSFGEHKLVTSCSDDYKRIACVV